MNMTFKKILKNKKKEKKKEKRRDTVQVTQYSKGHQNNALPLRLGMPKSLSSQIVSFCSVQTKQLPEDTINQKGQASLSRVLSGKDSFLFPSILP